MIPEFSSDNELLPRFIEICEKLVNTFYNPVDIGDFQKKNLMSIILTKGEVVKNIAGCPTTTCLVKNKCHD